MKKTKKKHSYLVLTVLAATVMYYVLSLSKSDRGTVDWIVISLVAAAILWNLVMLGRRLYTLGGGKDLWHLQRTVLFWIIGLFNTALIRPDDIGSPKNWLGWALLLLALVDSISIFRKEMKSPGKPACKGVNPKTARSK